MITAIAARSSSARRSALVSAGLLLATAVGVVLPASPSAAAEPSCHEVTLPVELSKSGMRTEVGGTLCVPSFWANGEREIDVLVHGGSYNRSYWDWPQDNEKYSYVKRALADGRATFAYDRIGAGENERPPSALVTVTTDAYVLHQVVQWARQDHDTVNLISHSIGGIVAMEEAARYDDVDTLVVTGMLHGIGIGVSGALTFNHFYPALLDEAFQGRLVDPGWVTTVPGTRKSSFFYEKTADPDVIAYDEAHKDVTTETTLVTTMLQNKLPPLLNPSARIRVPVLTMVGDHDDMFCDLLLDCTNPKAVYANEKPFYASAESLTVEVVPETGHDLTLHPSSGHSYELIADWLADH